ncbi:large conductance mechanosensitive channel protein MscL [Cytophaga hutchinsonii]|jgi:large conductance mechanosensitive channel|uniref:Large-conductance mechanosensitive channel n=1 Tax=Cytophaga hutchinsonii (strain ATCC 33406 / DSM 1761 / CIP 103989 / NBRC 15051 / NCIMB 9469 / D465) TaxID=269798 RepID=MSCL_CYTH3|nr:large conductance mechanosensitive channel protein MscL [Cytophaga hutchinsonii]Q11TN7.1 RecName: Full=Large-conductance mechanosensitive channel [Cytophaga hutchinsonii ATCC 33406]ABG59227.1 mechanosensitive channel [Cytophaga hutchinsonii ATCC 33406]SFX33863.1 large conductance mechanosensitive channel [Cytophaga hutchinsonii ATCC 33406]
MSFIGEFKAFAMRGNVVDLAVGVIIGGAFGKIVSSMVDDLIMPIVSIFMGDKGFKDKFFVFGNQTFESLAKAKEAGVPVFAYGNFIQTVIDFTILAFVIFLMVKGMNNLKKKEEAAAPAPVPAEPTKEEQLLTEIRDLLKK